MTQEEWNRLNKRNDDDEPVVGDEDGKMTQEEYNALVSGGGYSGNQGGENYETTEEGFKDYLMSETQKRGGAFSQDEVISMYKDYFQNDNYDEYSDPTAPMFLGNDAGIKVQRATSIFKDYEKKVVDVADVVSSEEYETQQNKIASDKEWGIYQEDTNDTMLETETPSYGNAVEDAEMLTKLKEQSLINELLMGQKGAMVGELGLEEMQSKYGISGGMALAQETQRQAQVSAGQQPIYGALSALPYEQKLLEGELASSNAEDEYNLRLLQGKVDIQDETLKNLLIQNNLWNNGSIE